MSKFAVDRDKIEEFYDDRYEGTYMYKHGSSELYKVKDLLNELSSDISNILDYGCGSGGWIELLSKTFCDARICGIDISNIAIEKARKRFPRYEFHIFDGENAPFENESFDLIFSYHVLEHVYEMNKVLDDISRLLRNDGFLCIISPCGNENSFEEKLVNLVKDGKEKSIGENIRFFYEDPGHIRRIKSRDVIELLGKNGILLFRDFYANQFWGSVDWIVKSGSGFIKELFAYKRSRDFFSKVKLLVLRILFQILELIIHLSRLDLYKHIKLTKNPIRQLLLCILAPIKSIALLFAKTIGILSSMEWRFNKTKMNGSAQYLIFRKQR